MRTKTHTRVNMDVPRDVKKILGPNEEIQLYIKQKTYHPKINIDSVDSVVITNMRVILRHLHALGLRREYTDYNYQDMVNIVLDKVVMRSTMWFIPRFSGEPFALEDLPHGEADRAYGIIRQNLNRSQGEYGTGPVTQAGSGGVALAEHDQSTGHRGGSSLSSSPL